MKMSITLTEHQRAEFARCAQAMYAKGKNRYGHALSAASAIGYLNSAAKYDQLHHAYCAWLVFDQYPD